MIPADIEQRWDDVMKMLPGESIRIQHLYKDTGEPCSLNKDNCMIVTRYGENAYYYCHRCKEQGPVMLNNASPDQALKLIEHSQDSEPEYVDVEEGFNLPKDCVAVKKAPVVMLDSGGSVSAMSWLRQYGITDDDILEHGILYSPAYDRIIFPIYEPFFTARLMGMRIIGWVGRCYFPYDKETRQKLRRPKYLTKKNLKYESTLVWASLGLFQTATQPDKLIIVEDIISAIKVQKAYNVDVVALLGTSLDVMTCMRFNNYSNYLWLDKDAEQKGREIVTKANTRGLEMQQIITNNDPKMYRDKDIISVIERG